MLQSLYKMELKCIACEGAFVTHDSRFMDHHMQTVHADLFDEDDTRVYAHNSARAQYLDQEAPTAFDLVIDPRDVDRVASTMPSVGSIELTAVVEDQEPTKEPEMQLTDDQAALVDTMYNMDFTIDTRIAAFEKLVEIDSREAVEIVQVMNFKMFTTKSSYVFEFLTTVLTASSIDVMLKHLIALNLFVSYRHDSDKRDNVFKTVIAVVDTDDMPTMMRIDAASKVVEDVGEHASPAKEHAMDMLERIFHSPSASLITGRRTSNEVRFKALTCLNFLPSFQYRPWLESNLLRMARNAEHDPSLRILAAQMLLYQNNVEGDMVVGILAILRSILDGRFSREVRNDAADILLNYLDRRSTRTPDEEDHYNRARAVIMEYGGWHRSFTVFDNSENVHLLSMKDSANRIMEYLHSKVPSNTLVEFDDISVSMINALYAKEPTQPKMEEGISEEEKSTMRAVFLQKCLKWKGLRNSVSEALTRVLLDGAMYGRHAMTLVDIVRYIWTFSEKHEHKDLLRERLEEELFDAHDLCSTGHAYRLLNTLSGICEEASMQISEQERFLAKVHNELNKCIMEQEDQEMVAKVLEEMANPNKSGLDRTYYNMCMYGALAKVEMILKKEYEGVLDEIDFAIYMRKAWLKYDDPESTF